MNYLIGQQIEHYQVEALLGEGGMGAVYRALDMKHDRLVALKVMHAQLSQQPQFQQRFAQEAQAALNFNSPSIVKIYQHGTHQGIPFIVMEYVPGGSLTALLQQRHWSGRGMRLDEVIVLAAQVADGLAYAHQRGIIHRDIKPDNILLKLQSEQPGVAGGQLRQALITDFGLAIQLKTGEDVATNPFMGSLAYMSPEQCLNLHLDGRSDIYSLGVMLYQLATGQLPFKIDAPADIIKHVEETPLPPRLVNPDLPEAVETIILKTLAKKPGDRYQTGAELAHTLRQIALSATTQAPHAGTDLVVTQWIEQRWVAGVDVGSRIDVNQTWISEGEFRLFVAHQWEQSRVVSLVGEPVQGKQSFTIGRHPGNDLVLDDRSVSGQHVQLQQTEGGWQVRDLGSTNGTVLGNTTLAYDKPVSWHSDESLCIGPYSLKWQAFNDWAVRRGGARMLQATLPAATVGDGRNGSAAGQMTPVQGRPIQQVQERRPGLAGVVSPDQPVAGADLSLVSTSDAPDVSISPWQIEVVPGTQNSVQVTVSNHGLTVEDISLRVEQEGQLPAWLALDQTQMKLMPDESRTVTLTLAPPQDSTLLAGEHTYRIVAATARGASGASQGQVDVGKWENFSLDMHPSNLQEKVVCRVTISDNSNYENTYVVAGTDDSDALLFDFEEQPGLMAPAPMAEAGEAASDGAEQWIRLAAGQEHNVGFTIKPRRRAWFGRDQIYAYEMRVRSETSPWQSLFGQVEIRPRVSRRVLLFFVLLLILLGIGAYYGYKELQAQREAEVRVVAGERDAALQQAQAERERAQSEAAALEATAAAAQQAVEEARASGASEEEIAAREAAAAEAAAAAASAEAAAQAAQAAEEQAAAAAAEAAADAAATNNPPTNISLDVSSIAEDSPIGTIVGRFTTADPDVSAARSEVAGGATAAPVAKSPIQAKVLQQAARFTYSLVSGPGSDDNRAFTIDGDALKTAVLLDFETQNSYRIRVETDDGLGGTFEKEFVISVTDVDDTPELSIADISVSEDKGKATVTVSLEGINNDTVIVEYATSDGTAIAGKDYTTTRGTLTWQAGETDPLTFDVDIVDDDLDEVDETFILTLSNVQNATIGDGTATITITDDDGQPTLSVADLMVTKSVTGGKATITVLMSGGSSKQVSVNYATADGTAKAGQDYVAASGTLTWAPDQVGAAIFSVTLIDDSVNEPNEDFTVTLSNPQNATIGAGTAKVTITDDDAVPQLAVSDTTADEADGKKQVTVTMTGQSSSVVSVDYATSDGTAKAGNNGDYVATTGTLSWPAGTSGAKTFDVSINNDNVYEPGGETFNITLSNPKNAATSDPLAVVNIVDNDPMPTLQMEMATRSVDERSSNNANTVTVNVELVGAANVPVTASFVLLPGSATNTSDYAAVTTSPLTWNAEQTGVKPIDISIVGDNLDEANETFTVQLSGSTNATLLTSASTTLVTIVDDDSPPTLSVADVTVGESDGTATVNVTMTGQSGSDVTVDYATVNGTSATPGPGQGADYTAIQPNPTNRLTWAAGSASGTVHSFTVSITSDELDEPDETFEIELSNPVSATFSSGSTLRATVTIQDDDTTPVITPPTTPFALLDEDRAPASIGTLAATDADGDTPQSWTIVTANPGPFSLGSSTGLLSQTGPFNYETAQSYTFQVTVGDGTNTSAPVDVTIDINDINEGPPTNITLSNSTIAENSANNTLIGTFAATGDPDTFDTHTFALTNTAGGRFKIASGNQLQVANGLLLDYEANITHTITVNATDSGTPSLSFSKSFVINLTNANDGPADNITLSGNSVNENATANTVVGTLAATGDPDGDSQTFSLTDDAGGRFKIASGTQLQVDTGAPLDYESNITHTITVRATDSGIPPLFFEKSFTINVNNLQEAPVVSNVSKSGPEDNDITFTQANFTSQFTDDDGDILVQIQVTTLPANGTLRDGANAIGSAPYVITRANLGNLVFDPNQDWNGSTSFGWNGYDGTSYAASPASVNITITPVQDLPTVSNVPKTGTEDNNITFTQADFTSHFNDVDNDPLARIRVTSLPPASAGTVKLGVTPVSINQEIPSASLSNLLFDPANNWFGNTVFGWNGNDGTAYANIGASVFITVTSVNDLPTLSNISKSGPEDNDITFSQTDFTSKFNDVDGDNLDRVRVASLPANGTLRLGGIAVTLNQEILAASLSTLVFDPNNNWNGNTSFNWNGRDGTAYASSNAAVNITITPIQDLPTVSNFSKSGTEDNDIIFTQADFTSNFSDVDGDSLDRIRVTTLPANGTLRLSSVAVTLNQEILSGSLGTLTFDPADDWNGNTSFNWNGNDGTAYATSGAVVSISLSAVNDAPVLNTSVTMTLTEVLSTTANPAGNTVASILATGAGGDPISDPDVGALDGVAITAFTTTPSCSGCKWQFSTNGGSNWSDIKSSDFAYLLNPAALIRFNPSGSFVGSATISFRAWDQTSGQNGDDKVNITVTGGSSAYSASVGTASVNVR